MQRPLARPIQVLRARLDASARTPVEVGSVAGTGAGSGHRESGLSRVLSMLDPAFLLTLFGAAALRFYNLNWDQHTHIHPDERFLTMYGIAEKLPSSVGQYMDPHTSPLNPANLQGFSFFVYGVLPITINKYLAVLLHNDSYDSFVIQGRFLSALADCITVFVIYKAAQLLRDRYRLPAQIAYLAPFFYGIAVLPIQLSHFFAVDSFLNLFMFVSFYFALRYSLDRGGANLVLSAAAFGLAVACKTSAIFILPLNLFFIAVPLLQAPGHDTLTFPTRLPRRSDLNRRTLRRVLEGGELLVTFAVVSYLCLRVADPYMFETANIFNPTISHLFLDNLKTLQSYNNPTGGFPPGVQWVHKLPIIFSLNNLVFFGFGLVTFMFAVAGCYLVVGDEYRVELAVILLWMLAYFLFQSSQYVKTMRYFIFLYPFLAIFAAIGFQAITARLRPITRTALVVALLVWPLAFLSIYVHPLSRVQASNWIYQNLPNNSVILSESWDDPLPLSVPNTYGKTFRGQQLPVFDPDTSAEKWKSFRKLLSTGDYLILSSNRGWGSMPTVPEQYPRMTTFYHNLFAGKPLIAGIRYKRIATFTSFPSLSYVGIPIDFPDQWAEEAFTVYDHPEVQIFERVT